MNIKIKKTHPKAIVPRCATDALRGELEAA